MSKTLDQLPLTRSWIAYIDDERAEGNSIIVTLGEGFYFADERDCGVRGFDTVREVLRGTARNAVVFR
jgi:hypothetical protein